ncbi:MAG: hypothetical protein OXN81_03360 [Alphaproteobacteria bacterium]|nr:hypothetical protein [Alphaproteobacteria bacterium]
MDWLDLATQILAGLILLAISWVIHSVRGIGRRIDSLEDAVDSRLDRAETRLVRAEEIERHNVIDRLGEVEKQVASCTSQDQLRRIHARIDEDVKSRGELGQQISELSGVMNGVRGTVQLIQRHLMERGGGPSP